MKEKRYYCDWALESSNKKSHHELKMRKVIILLSLVVVTVISSLIYYNIIIHNNGGDLEAYFESDYEYLDEIANYVIEKDGINVAAIPKDVVEYEINYKDGEIIFTYSLDNNKGKEWAAPASMTVTLSKGFEILNKEPNFSSKEEYVKHHKIGLCIFVLMLGALTWWVMAFASWIIMIVAIPISMIHKKKDMKNNLS